MAKFTGHTITSDSALGSAVIKRSLRFNGEPGDDHYLERTPSSAGNRQVCTFSCWTKRSNINVNHCLASAYSANNNNDNISLNLRSFGSGDCEFRVVGYYNNFRITNNKFRDPSAWLHLVVAFDTTQSSADDRIKVYFNGVQETSFSTSGSVTQNMNIAFNAASVHRIGTQSNAISNTADGYIAEVNFIDGYQYDPSYFGFTDPVTNIWMPKRYEGIYGTNGYYLDFSDNSSAAALGIDKSPNGNDFTVNNISVSAGTGDDSSLDTPSNNFATLSSLAKDSQTTLSNGNLQAAGSQTSTYNINTQGNFVASSGKWYYEVEFTSGSGSCAVGWIRPTLNHDDNPTLGGGIVYRPTNGDYIDLAGNTPTGKPTTSTGTVIQVAIDLDAGKIWFGSGGTYFESGDPSAGTNAAMTFTGGDETLSPVVRTMAATFNFNFGQRDYSYTVPTGFKSLRFKNLSLLSPSVASVLRPKKHFDVKYYTGQNTSSLYNVTGLEFPPDLVIAKARNTNIGHIFIDTVRGNDRQIETPDTSAEVTRGSAAYRFLNDGFAVSTVGNLNNPNNYAAFCWRAGGNSNTFNVDGKGYTTAAAAGITDGSIALTGASVNTDAGFSIVKYTSPNSSSDQTVGHGLGKKPDWILVKNLDNSFNWDIYHSGKGYNSSLIFTASTTRSGAFAAEPTSTVFHTKTNYTHNSTHEYVAYCWTEIPGYSKFGTYTGNDNDDGPFVNLGFSPAWVMVKCTSNSEHWNIPLFTNGDRANGTVKFISPNLTNDERNMDDNPGIDFLSNGFKVRTSDGNMSRDNGAGNFIYMAFAEQPGLTPFDTFPNAR